MDNAITLPSGFRHAIRAFQHSLHKRPMGCVFLRHGRPVVVGWNVPRTHPLYADGITTYSIHAEVDAILHSTTSLAGTNLYVYRLVQNKPAMARPCQNCLPLLIEAGVSKIYYTINTPPYYEILTLNKDKR